MAGLAAFMPSSLLLSSQFQLQSSRQTQNLVRTRAPTPICFLPGPRDFRKKFSDPNHRFGRIKASVVSDSKVPTTFTVDSAGEGIDVLPDSGGPNDNFGGPSDNSGGGGGGGNGGNNDEAKGEPEGGDDQSGEKGMSMSQKLTLGYAALVGIGGVMGYIKGGSQKSLIAGGASASILYVVFSMLPSNPVLASSLGLGLSGALLGVMGSRFKKSGKIFPAGVVAFASLIMTGGYLHGILRCLH